MFDISNYSDACRPSLQAFIAKIDKLDSAIEKRHDAYANAVIAFVPFFEKASEADITAFQIDYKNDGRFADFRNLFKFRAVPAMFKRKTGETYGKLIYGNGVKVKDADGDLASVLRAIAAGSLKCAAIRYQGRREDKEETLQEALLAKIKIILDGIKLAKSLGFISDVEYNNIKAALNDKEKLTVASATLRAEKENGTNEFAGLAEFLKTM